MDLPTNTPSLLTPSGTNPFTPGGASPFEPSGLNITDLDKKVFGAFGINVTPNVDSEGNRLAGEVKGLFADSTIGGFFTRFGLEILGVIFIGFGFFMLAIRGGEAAASSEAGRAIAKLAV